jgi:hypothetical protein
MSFLNSFIHGGKLAEFLIEGHNPDARLKLSTADVDALRQQMQPGEVLKAYIAGRVVMSGAGVWVLTDQHLMIRHAVQPAMTRVDVRQIDRFEAVRGRYGHTVRIAIQGRLESLYGVDAQLAMAMHRALQSMGITCSFEDKPPRGTLWAAYSGPHPSVEDCVSDARQRLMQL